MGSGPPYGVNVTAWPRSFAMFHGVQVERRCWRVTLLSAPGDGTCANWEEPRVSSGLCCFLACGEGRVEAAGLPPWVKTPTSSDGK